jgi:isoquinoline 1-oxidoreductase subunit beta
LHIGPDGTITVFTSKVEFGQGSRTEITAAAGEELHASLESIRLVMADSAFGPNDGGTAGSRTTPDTIPSVRRGCAAARQILIETAARTFNVEAGQLSVRDGRIEGLGGDRSFSYADLAADLESLKSAKPADVQLKPAAEWQILGQPVSKIDGRDVVTGAHRYPSDIVRPGMLYGRVLRAPSYRSELVKIDLDAARGLGEVIVVRDGNFVGVAAATSHLAERARQALARTAEWKSAPHPAREELFRHLETHAQNGRANKRGGPAPGGREFKATYTAAYIQHAPMEPRAAVAEWEEGKLTVWTGSQQPAREAAPNPVRPGTAAPTMSKPSAMAFARRLHGSVMSP